MYICFRFCICVCECVCVFVYIYMRARTHTHTNIQESHIKLYTSKACNCIILFSYFYPPLPKLPSCHFSVCVRVWVSGWV